MKITYADFQAYELVKKLDELMAAAYRLGQWHGQNCK